MKKWRYTLTGAAIIAAAVATTGCTMKKSDHPSDAGNTGRTEEYRVEDNGNTAVYGPPADYEPEDNKNEEVYGPPEEMDFIQ